MNRQGAVVKEKSFLLNAKAAAFAAIFAVSAGVSAHAADMPVKAPPPAKPVPFFFVNDTSVSFTWFANATDPGVAGSSNTVPGGVFGQKNSFSRYSGEIDHFDVWEYGTNLIHAEFDQYGDEDPNLGITNSRGSREFFAFSRSTIGLNEVTHSKMFSNVLFTDVGVEIGGNAGVQNNFLSEETTVGVFGLNFNLNLPGTVLFAVLADKEFTHNSFQSCGGLGFGVGTPGLCAPGFTALQFSGDREFEWAPRLELFVAEPLKFLPWPVTFVDVTNVIFPKGTGISTTNLQALGPAFAGVGGHTGAFNALADAETKTELFEDARLSLDSGKVFWGKPGIWDTYVGYRYWMNKFGTDHNAVLFSQFAPQTSIESTVYVGTTYHFK
jgi:hypothetical protein